MGLEHWTFVAPIVWLGAWVAGSIIYRRKLHKPLFPRAPDNAVFAEAWCSGRSLRNLLTRFGGARNCLLVYVVDGSLTIIPVFPFNLLFLPEIYGLEATVPVSQVRVASVEGLLGRRLRLTVSGVSELRFELSLRDQQGFREAVQGTGVGLVGAADTKRSERPRAGWRLNFFRVFAFIWGVGAAAGGVYGLTEDVHYRSHGLVTTARIAGHTGELGTKNDAGVLGYVVEGRAYTLTSLRGAGIYRIGDLEQVRYMPGDPASAREDDYLGFDLLFACLGACMLTLALTLGRIGRRFTRALNV